MSVSVPHLLALDTATERVYASLSVGGDVRSVDLSGGAQASAQLLPALQGLLQEAGLVWTDLDAIAFGAGPGAFTGLRTACAVTQGLALGANCPVLALDTLMVVAEDARLQAESICPPGTEVWVLQDARMEELYVSAMRWSGAGWLVTEEAKLWPLSEPMQRWGQESPRAQSVVLCGNALDVYPDRFAALWLLGVQRLGVGSAPRGPALASVAQTAWANGLAVDVALALPRYVRDKVAQTTAERRAAAAQPRYEDRALTESDIPQVLAMERAACEHVVHAWSEDNYRSSLRAGYWTQVRTDVATGRIVAVCVAMDGVDEVHLLNIVVAKTEQGRGVARAMLAVLYARCAQQAAQQLWLEVRASNVRARALYAREGFAEVGQRKGYYPAPEGREDAVVMCRQMVGEGSVRAVE